MNTGPDQPESSWPGALFRNVLRLVLIVGCVWAALLLVRWARGMAPLVDAGGLGIPFWLIWVLLAAYAVMIAVPFVPGIELGIALLMLEGARVAPAVLIATVAGLLMAFAAGALIPYPILERALRDLWLTRAADALARVDRLDRPARLAMIRQGLPRWFAPLADGWRYPALAILINFPGNFAVGGGGGLLMVAGFSRVFSPLPTILTVALAVTPVPLAVWLTGYSGMP